MKKLLLLFVLFTSVYSNERSLNVSAEREKCAEQISSKVMQWDSEANRFGVKFNIGNITKDMESDGNNISFVLFAIRMNKYNEHINDMNKLLVKCSKSVFNKVTNELSTDFTKSISKKFNELYSIKIEYDNEKAVISLKRIKEKQITIKLMNGNEDVIWTHKVTDDLSNFNYSDIYITIPTAHGIAENKEYRAIIDNSVKLEYIIYNLPFVDIDTRINHRTIVNTVKDVNGLYLDMNYDEN